MSVAMVAGTVRTLLQAIEQILAGASSFELAVDASLVRREAREILSALLGVSPGAVSRLSDEPASETLATDAMLAARRRTTGEPLAYCVGLAAFRNLVLQVDRRVLIPRPETEIVVEQAFALVREKPGGVAVDIGTGSGAIAISLATEGQFDRVIATDISADALAVARQNAARITHNSVSIEFREGADLVPIPGIKARVLVSNPPYIAFDESAALPASVREWEPATALFAESGGMERYDVLLAGAADHLEPGGWLVLEVDSGRARETARRAALNKRLSGVRLVKDLAGRDRVLVAQANGQHTSTN